MVEEKAIFAKTNAVSPRGKLKASRYSTKAP
jgi:hypothetical protein